VSNALRILQTLDRYLTAPVELTLYGKAALVLGFQDPPRDFGHSSDVDAVLWLGQAEQLSETTNFWDALERLNDELANDGLYMTHLFEEDQVILQPQWRHLRQAIAQPFVHLTVYRLGDLDLLLSKLMRDDPVDFADARFIVTRSGLSEAAIRQGLADARAPDEECVRDEFAKASSRLLAWLAEVRSDPGPESACSGRGSASAANPEQEQPCP
jgi:hypothetical protein